jgi:dolichol kinase
MDRAEWRRKAIHMLSLCFPIIYWCCGRAITLKLLVGVALFCIVLDMLRAYVVPLNRYYCQLFGSLLRTHEHEVSLRQLTGLTSMVVGMLLTVIIFPPSIAILALFILIISDTCAVIMGKTYPMTRLIGSKSLGGTLGFAISAILLVFVVGEWRAEPVTFVIAGWVAACAAAVAELVSPIIKIDDNFTIPIVFGSVAWALVSLM